MYQQLFNCFNFLNLQVHLKILPKNNLKKY